MSISTKRLQSKKARRDRKTIWEVHFLKERTPRFVKDLATLRASLKSSSLSSSSKKKTRKTISKILFFDQIPSKRYLVKLHRFCQLVLKVDISREISFVVRSYEERALYNGPISSVKHWKMLHDVYLRIITSNSFDVDPYVPTNADGFPSELGPLLALAKQGIKQRRAGLHAIQVLKLVTAWDTAEISLDTILKKTPVEMIDPQSKHHLGGYFERYISQFGGNSGGVDLNRLRQCYIQAVEATFPAEERTRRVDDLQKEVGVHFSGRNGPNGPCLTTVVVDYHCLTTKEENKGLFEAIYQLATATKNASLLTILTWFAEDDLKVSTAIEGKDSYHSRLSIKEESWGKRRLFAICDWFSQSSTLCIHNYLFKWLRKQKEDGTFDQDSVCSVVKQWSVDSYPESADLSAATDSIPVEVQCEIISHIFGYQIGSLWRRVCTDRDFLVPDRANLMVKYTAGQPMGILSSWAMLAVWHHIMNRTCSLYLNKDPGETTYVVVGDDVCMDGADLFSIYRVLVGTVQGVGISKSKGFHQETQHMDNPLTRQGIPLSMTTAEFTKRVFCCGHEMTVIPPDELFGSFESPNQFPEMIDSLKSRTYPITFDATSIPALTSLCRHRKQALLLAANPLRRCPLRVTPIIVSSFPSSTPWYQPGFKVAFFKQRFFKLLKGQLVTTLSTVISCITSWFMLLGTGDSVKVKGWVYNSFAQARLLNHFATMAAQAVSDKDEELTAMFKQRPVDWPQLKDSVRSLQTIFEVSYLLKEKVITRRVDAYHYSSKLLNKAVKEALEEGPISSPLVTMDVSISPSSGP